GCQVAAGVNLDTRHSRPAVSPPPCGSGPRRCCSSSAPSFPSRRPSKPNPRWYMASVAGRLPSLSMRAPGPPKKLSGRRRPKGSRNSGEKFLEDFYDIPGWRRPMRLMLIVATVAVAMLLDLRVSQATQMPWCAGTTKGDFFSYNCTLPTYEMCVQEVIAGNRGFCGPNPYYRGPEFVPARAKRK